MWVTGVKWTRYKYKYQWGAFHRKVLKFKSCQLALSDWCWAVIIEDFNRDLIEPSEPILPRAFDCSRNVFHRFAPLYAKLWDECGVTNLSSLSSDFLKREYMDMGWWLFTIFIVSVMHRYLYILCTVISSLDWKIGFVDSLEWNSAPSIWQRCGLTCLSPVFLKLIHIEHGLIWGIVDSLDIWPFLFILHWIGLLREQVLNFSLNASESPNKIRTHFFCARNSGESLLIDTPPHTLIPYPRWDSKRVWYICLYSWLGSEFFIR